MRYYGVMTEIFGNGGCFASLLYGWRDKMPGCSEHEDGEDVVISEWYSTEEEAKAALEKWNEAMRRRPASAKGERKMYVEKETEKGLLMVRDAVPFWIQRRWLKADGTLTPAGWKAYHIARKAHWAHWGYDALKEFAVARETEKAVLLRCIVERPDGPETAVEFWLPKSMTGDWNFVAAKVREVERGFPFVGTRVKWSGAAAESKQGVRA